MKLTKALYGSMIKMAKDRAWGRGIFCELGVRSIGNGPDWYNRLDPRDDHDSADLSDLYPLSDYVGVDLTEVDGRVLLDLWVHNSDELCCNVLFELDADGIGAAYEPSYTDDRRFYTRDGFAPQSEQHIPKCDSRIRNLQ